ncbi:MAG TPA: nucleoside triphosphate pyrophosphohydrolase [Dehalococcoidia bacterium]|jgi:tetrapyrrole methylase family protein/MazG family protein|nr:nucleoside triphosphate pyrophosphohydrolase [Dehalococcoidia bacterium]
MPSKEDSSQDQSTSSEPFSASFSNEELGTFQTLVDIVAKLRAPGGCPWDREQTHDSLKRNLLEESYEVIEAIDQGNPATLSEELGDLMVQIAFHADIAQEAGDFQLEDVLRNINSKLVRRHPHVFADGHAEDAREVERNWEQIKAAERQAKGEKKSPVEGIPADLPALAYAQLMQDRVGKAGFEWDDISGVLDKLVEEVAELKAAVTQEEKEHELGDILFTIVNLTRWTGAHAEDVLRQANQRFGRRYLSMESLAVERGHDFNALSLDEKEQIWQEAKRIVG